MLLLKTRPGRGGFWQPVTGSVEEGEALPDAARREADEETGLGFAGGPQPLDYQFRFLGHRGQECEEHVFALSANPGPGGILPEPVLDPHEHVEYRWLKPAEALPMTEFPSNQEGLRRLVAWLQGARR